MIGISSCLGGEACRYDGSAKTVPVLEALVLDGKAVMICPEVIGGLPTPRPSAEIVGGDGFAVLDGTAKIMTARGEDVTAPFVEGARKAYEYLKAQNISALILKEASPSCGSCLIYDGSFSGRKKAGLGVAAAYFKRQGLKVYSDEDWVELEKKLSEAQLL